MSIHEKLAQHYKLEIKKKQTELNNEKQDIDSFIDKMKQSGLVKNVSQLSGYIKNQFEPHFEDKFYNETE